MKNWILFVAFGVVAIILGVICLLNPLPASLTIEMYAAWCFIIIGSLQTFMAFCEEGWDGKLWALILGILAVILGINLLSEPLAGLVTLTVIIGTLFIISGIVKAIFGFKMIKKEFKMMMLFSAAVSFILGLMIVSNIPASATYSLGILLGVELISGGISTLMFGISTKSSSKLERIKTSL